MRYSVKFLLALIASVCLVSSQGCLGKENLENRIAFVVIGEPAPFTGVLLTREDFNQVLEALEEAESDD